MDFHPIKPVINAWLNRLNLTNVRAFESSSQWISTQFDHPIQPVINAWSDWASSQWISIQFNQ